MKEERVGVVIPAYQVASHIGEVIRAIPGDVDLIVVVDDASTDGTSERASETRDPRLRVLRHSENRGSGRRRFRGWTGPWPKGARSS